MRSPLLTSPRRLGLAAAAAGALLAFPAAAPAAVTTFCVNATCPPGATAKPTLEAALGFAQNEGGPATILLGPKPDGTPYAGPFEYHSGGGDNSVHVVGQGRPKLTTPVADTNALTLDGPANVVEGVDFLLSAGDGTALVLDGGKAEDVHVTATDGTSRGVLLTDDAALHGSDVDVAGTGVTVAFGSGEIARTTVQGEVGVSGSVADVRLVASRIRAEMVALGITGGSGGSGGIPEGLTVTGSELTTSADQGRGIQADDVPVRLTRTTIAGRSGAPVAGRAAVDLEAFSKSVAIDARTTVLAGYDRTIARHVAAGLTAGLTVDDAEWRLAGEVTDGAGLISTSRGGFHDQEPRFVDRAADDLRLRAGDPAVDGNRELVPDDVDALDLLGHGAVDGDGDGVARTDLGAYEFLGEAPVIDDAESVDTPAEVAAADASATPGPVGSSGGPAIAPDRTAPSIRSARLSIRRGALRRGAKRARLAVKLSEAATLRIAVVRRTGKRAGRPIALALRAGAGARRVAIGDRRLRLLARRRAVVSITAIDAAGNRSEPVRLRLTVRR